ncbi:MAG: sodium-dependent transporter [Clostridia bacterium]|nr:sodium-dependent transporter [Clostridia bacterium]
MQRERLSSRLGFILLSAGCAIGIGNVWKFPWVAGNNGGGAFVLIYLLFLVIMGLPVLTMEFALGRASQKSPVDLYKPLEPKGTKWHLHGYLCFAGAYILMMFYTTVSGWMVNYFVSTAAGRFDGLDKVGIQTEFDSLLADPVTMIFYTGIVIVIAVVVCSLGLNNGLERITKYMMLALLAIMVGLAINSFFMEGSSEGLKFYLVPDFEKLNTLEKLIGVVSAAMQQAFFTLSLGLGSMAIFGSYIGKERALLGESINVATLDTFVAVTSGLIIFPACFTYNIDVNAGPDLIFVTLPNVFNSMPAPYGRIIGTFFFVFMSFAALSTVLAVFQMIIACLGDKLSWSKKKACIIAGAVLFVLSLPCILGFNLIPNINFFDKTADILDIEDFIVSNLLLPIGSLIFVIFCTNKRYGWGFKNFKDAANEGKGMKVRNWMRCYMTYVLPLMVLTILVLGVISWFK